MCPCRDIKPSNLVMDEAEAAATVYLVDFGGVQAAAAAEGDASQLGSTIIGTYGCSCLPLPHSQNSIVCQHAVSLYASVQRTSRHILV